MYKVIKDEERTFDASAGYTVRLTGQPKRGYWPVIWLVGVGVMLSLSGPAHADPAADKSKAALEARQRKQAAQKKQAAAKRDKAAAAAAARKRNDERRKAAQNSAAQNRAAQPAPNQVNTSTQPKSKKPVGSQGPRLTRDLSSLKVVNVNPSPLQPASPPPQRQQKCTVSGFGPFQIRTCSDAPVPAASARPVAKRPSPTATPARPARPAPPHQSAPPLPAPPQQSSAAQPPSPTQQPTAADQAFWAQGKSPSASPSPSAQRAQAAPQPRPTAQASQAPSSRSSAAPQARLEVEATRARAQKGRVDGVSYQVFGIDLGEPMSFAPCAASTPKTSSGSPTCVVTAEPSSSAPVRQDSAVLSDVAVTLGADRCPAWLRNSGCSMVANVQHGVLLGTTVKPDADASTVKSVVQQLSEKYGGPPKSGSAATCRQASGKTLTQGKQYLWPLPAMQVTYSPIANDCKQGEIRVELQALQEQRAQAAAQAEPRM